MACPASVEREAARRGLAVLDATCPLVRRVHLEGAAPRARPAARSSSSAIAAMWRSRAPRARSTARVHVIESVAEALTRAGRGPGAHRLRHPDDALRRRYAARSSRPEAALSGDPGAGHQDDLLRHAEPADGRARHRRQRAERIIVCGARNSSNTNRLREVAANEGRPALLMQDPKDLTSPSSTARP